MQDFDKYQDENLLFSSILDIPEKMIIQTTV